MQRFKFFKKGLKDGIPIFLGYLAVSFTFGISAKNAGATSLQSVIISATNLTSAGQFAALNVIATAGTYFEMAFTQLIINLRYCLMSSALSQKLSHKMPFWHRFIMAFGVTDEIFGVSVSVDGKINPYYSYGLMSAAIPGWTLGTFLGVVFGNLLPIALGDLFAAWFGATLADPTQAAEKIVASLSIALYGMFIAVVIPPARKSKKIAGIVIVSMLCSLAFDKLPVLCQISQGFRIIILTVIIASVAAILFPVKPKDEDGEVAQ